jgi:uncharacterized protein (DUF1499 family)
MSPSGAASSTGREGLVRGVTIVAIAGTVVLGAVVMLAPWPLINVVETGRTPEYPDLQPRKYRAEVSQVFDAALHAVDRMPRWTILAYQPESGEIKAEAKSLVFRFVDDVVIRVTSQGASTVVSVRSASRIGRGDFGQNARNIRAFLRELDRQVERALSHV